jgi:N-acyl-D-aspartate/D-glutamate deacylase
MPISISSFAAARAVHALSRGNALAVGMTDRGLIAPGMKADLNVIDTGALPGRLVRNSLAEQSHI